MTPTEIDLAANRVVDYLKAEGAVRVSVDQVGNHKSVFEICDALKDLYSGNWIKVKNRLLQRGVPICYTPGKGHFIGFKGEEISNVVYKYKIARGWVKHLKATRAAIEASAPEAREWIARRFKDFSTEEGELAYADTDA